MRSALASALSAEEVNQVGLQTGQSKRLRKVTPVRLFMAIIAALGGARVESLADLLREFNHQNKTTVAYKAFYNRLAHQGFAEFMRQMLCRLLGALALRILEAEAGSALTVFEDIVIHDGSSFALKDALRRAFPGRFTAFDPAAVELHATFSGFEDNIISVALAADKEAERQFLPEPQELRNKLLLADRGYPSVDYFLALGRAGASFIIRLTRSYMPWVLAVFVKSKRQPLRRPIRLAEFLSQTEPGALPRSRRGVLPGKEDPSLPTRRAARQGEGDDPTLHQS